MAAFPTLERLEDPALFHRKTGAVLVTVMDELVHILAEKIIRMVVAEDRHAGTIAESTFSLKIYPVNTFSRRIQEQTDVFFGIDASLAAGEKAPQQGCCDRVDYDDREGKLAEKPAHGFLGQKQHAEYHYDMNNNPQKIEFVQRDVLQPLPPVFSPEQADCCSGNNGSDAGRHACAPQENPVGGGDRHSDGRRN